LAGCPVHRVNDSLQVMKSNATDTIGLTFTHTSNDEALKLSKVTWRRFSFMIVVSR